MGNGIRVDFIGGPFNVGVPVDIGWGFAVMNADFTITRTCYGCGVRATTAVTLTSETTGKVVEAAITHKPGCKVVSRLGNNAILS